MERGGKHRGIDVDADIDLFEITKFNYRTLFDKSELQNISHIEMVYKFFEIENISDVDLAPQSQKLFFKNHPDEWKQLFIFFLSGRLTNMNLKGLMGTC